MSPEIDSDPVAADLRAAILANDTEILALLNRRLELVTELSDHKAQHGYPAVDVARETRLYERLLEENDGPAEEAYVREVFGAVLAATKRQVYGPDAVGG